VIASLDHGLYITVRMSYCKCTLLQIMGSFCVVKICACGTCTMPSQEPAVLDQCAASTCVCLLQHDVSCVCVYLGML